jgi:hypothetical protein
MKLLCQHLSLLQHSAGTQCVKEAGWTVAATGIHLVQSLTEPICDRLRDSKLRQMLLRVHMLQSEQAARSRPGSAVCDRDSRGH